MPGQAKEISFHVMDIALTALLFVALLALSIALLHQQQEKAARENAERSAPLIEPERIALAPLFGAAGRREATSTATARTRIFADEPAHTASEPVTVAPVPMAPDAERIDKASNATTATRQHADWQQDVRALRQQAQYREAHLRCQAHYPRVQAFQQSMLCLRAQLRTLDSQTTEFAEALGELYRVAVVGDLFRPAMLKKQRKRAGNTEALVGMALRNLNIAYDRIGYRQLALLSKTDCRLLTAHWGEPQKHCHAEHSVDADWQNQLQLFSS